MQVPGQETNSEKFAGEHEKPKGEELFPLMVLSELENAILEGNTDTFKKLSNLIDSTIDLVTLRDYYDNTANSMKNTNLVILACKHNKIKILEAMFSSDSRILDNLSIGIEKTAILPNNEDEQCHNAFYYAIRWGNIDILDMLINKWPINYFAANLSKLDDILSTAYDELKLKNVALSDEMEIYVQNKLIDLRFFSNNTPRQDQHFKDDLNNTIERIDIILQNIRLLKADYSSAEKVDEKFLFLAKSIAQNIHILKRQLKSTYDRLPWEEMEFSLVIFVSSHTKRQENNLFYRVTLNKSKILNYLENFAKRLADERDVIKCGNNGKLAFLPRLVRDKVVADIISSYPEFEEFYNDYQQIRDNYSLKKISDHINLALSADPLVRDEGPLIITRVLQVIGEHLKNTLESPKLSHGTSEVFLLSLSKNARKIIIDLRDSLSHAESLSKRIQIEENADVDFVINIQNDTKRIGDVITDILYKNKLKSIRILLTKIATSENSDEIQEIAEELSSIEFDRTIPQNFIMTEDEKLEKLVKELSDKIVGKTIYEEELFSKIYSIIRNEASAPNENIKTDYVMGFMLLKSLSNGLRENRTSFNNISAMQFIAKITLNNLTPKIEPNRLKEISKLLVKIYHSVRSSIQHDNLDELNMLLSKLFCFAEFATGDIKWIEELRERLNEKDSSISAPPTGKQRRVRNAKEEKLKDQLALKLSALKGILGSNSLNDRLTQKLISYKSDIKLQAVVEMLLLDVMSILGSSKNSSLENNLLFLEDNTPLLNGKCLRNYLAHDNAVVDILLSDPSIVLILNAIKLTEENLTTSKKKMGKFVGDDPFILKEKYHQWLTIIAKQKKMFVALEEGNLEMVKDCLRKGTDIHARGMNSWTTLHFAAKGNNLEVIKFILDQYVSVNVKDINGQSPLHIAAEYGRQNIVEFLVKETDSYIDDINNRGKTPLNLAAQNGQKETVEVLLKHNANTVTQDINGFAPLHSAIKNNHIDIVKLLLEKDANVDINESIGGFTPLHSAAESGHLELVQFLIQNKADINARTDKHSIPLHAAVINGHLDVVNTLILHGADVNNILIDGVTALHGAMEVDNEEIAKILLKHGANVNAVDKIYNNTPLNYAARFGQVRIVETLLQNNANASIGTFTGQTPLHLAVRRNHVNMVTALIKHGVDIVAKTMNKSTPLHFAAECGHKEVAEILIRSGAEIDAKAFDNFTPLHIAAEEGHKDVASLLINNKADVNARNIKGFTPLVFAAMNGSKDSIDLLMQNKAEVNNRANNNKTPLHTAALNGRGDAVDLLIKNGAEVNVRDNDGNTPLHYAAMNGHIDVVKLLINNEAEVDVQSLSDNTPLHIAVEAGHKEIVEILIAYGANVNNIIVTAKNMTSLLLAIKNNHKDVVEILIANGANVNESVGDHLSMAVAIGYIDIVEILLKNKAMVNKRDPTNSTPLHMAAVLGNKKVVKVLITNGADVDALTIENVTPVYFAAEEGHADIVGILIASGANLNIKTDIDMTPLEVAITRGHGNVVKMLLDNNANIHVKCNNRTTIELAVENGHLEVVKILLQYKEVNIHVKSDDDSTLLHLASGGSNFELVKFLVGEGIDINVRNASGLQSIHVAAREGYRDTVEFFLNNGFGIEDPGAEHQKLLHYAAMNLEVVKYLIAQGADVNAQDANGLAPMHFAADFGHKGCIEVLLKNGAVYNSVNKLSIRPLESAKDKDVINLLATTKTLFEAVQRNSLLEVTNCIEAGAFVNAKDTESEMPLHYAAQKGYDEVVNVLLQNEANPNVVDNKGLTPLHYAAKFSHLKVVKTLLSNYARYNPISDCGKTPSDFTVDKSITSLFNLVDESFKSVEYGNPQVVHDLNKIEDIDTVKAVMSARNKENQTLVIVAMLCNFSEVEQLKQIAQGDVSAEIDSALELLNHDNYREAFNIFKKVFVRRKEILGLDNPGTLDIQKHVADVLYRQGFYREALNTLEEILEKQTKMLGFNYKDTLNTRSTIAYVLHSQGNDEEAFHICQEVYDKQKKLLGSNHSDTLDTQFCFALVLNSQGKYKEALSMNKVVFDERLKTSGANHPMTVQAENNIAMVVANQGKYEEALKMYKEVFEKKNVGFGNNHSDTLRTLGHIGIVLFKQQKYREALKTHHKVLSIQKNVLGPYHPNTLITQYNIANVLFAQYKLIGSFQFYRKCSNQMKAVFVPGHPIVLDIAEKIKSIRRGFKFEGSHESQILHILQGDIKTAAINGEVQTVQSLLEEGANVNDKDFFGKTPLHHAVSNGHIDVVSILLKDGADVNVTCNQGNTPLQIAISKGYKEIAEILLHHVSQNNFCNL